MLIKLKYCLNKELLISDMISRVLITNESKKLQEEEFEVNVI